MTTMANASKGVTVNINNAKRKPRFTNNQRARSTRPNFTPAPKFRKRRFIPNRNRRRRQNTSTTGPKPAVSQTITATLGTVGSNLSDVVETECAVFLNPIIAKDSGASATFGPLQSLGAQYALWRLKWLEVRLQPLVGNSAVSGTVARVSLNMTTGPTLNSWSGLGARIHKDVRVGSNLVWRIKQRLVSGPCETWWKTNTAEDPSLSLGPALEVHTIGKTMSTYKNEVFSSGLFLLEITGHWEFANYAASPALATLTQHKDDSETTKTLAISSDGANEPVEMLIPVNEWNMKAQYGGNGTLGEAIYQVVDTSVTVVTDLFPPPFSWIGKASWWFIRKMIGKTKQFQVVVNGQNQTLTADVYRVYTSASAARDDKPAISSKAHEAKHLTGAVVITQISTDNILSETTYTGPRSIVTPETPIGPSSYPMTPSSLVLMAGYFSGPEISDNFGKYMPLLFQQDTSKVTFRSGSHTIKIVSMVLVDRLMWLDKHFNQYTNEPDGVFGDVGNVFVDNDNVAKVITMSGSSAPANRGATLMLCKATKDIQTFNFAATVFIPAYKVKDGAGGKDVVLNVAQWEANKTLTYPAIPKDTYFMVVTMGGASFTIQRYVVYNEGIGDGLELPAFWGKYLSQLYGFSWSSPTYACVTWEPIYADEGIPHRSALNDDEVSSDGDTDDDTDTEDEDEFFGEDPMAALHALDEKRPARRAMFDALVKTGVSVEEASKCVLRACPTKLQIKKRNLYESLLCDGLSPESSYEEAYNCK